MKRRHTYDHMSGAQLSQALDDLGLSLHQFAYLSGAKEDNVQKWLRNELDIPHWAFVLVSLLHLPDAMSMARKVTDVMAHDRREDERG